MDDAIKEALLRSLTKEDVLELFNEAEQVQDKTSFLDDPMSDSAKFYLSRKIPGSTKKCGSCGQSMVNDEDHATELLGGENN